MYIILESLCCVSEASIILYTVCQLNQSEKKFSQHKFFYHKDFLCNLKNILKRKRQKGGDTPSHLHTLNSSQLSSWALVSEPWASSPRPFHPPSMPTLAAMPCKMTLSTPSERSEASESPLGHSHTCIYATEFQYSIQTSVCASGLGAPLHSWC